MPNKLQFRGEEREKGKGKRKKSPSEPHDNSTQEQKQDNYVTAKNQDLFNKIEILTDYRTINLSLSIQRQKR